MTTIAKQIAATVLPPNQQRFYQFQHFAYPSIEAVGISPLRLDHREIANLNPYECKGLVSPPLSAVVYRWTDVQSIFLALLALQLVGEFFGAASLALADAATVGCLEHDAVEGMPSRMLERYGRQRVWGTFGWALAMFVMGIVLQQSTSFPEHPCGTDQPVDRNYDTCFASFGVCLCLAVVAATRLRFHQADSTNEGHTIALEQMKDKVVDTVQAKITGKKSVGKSGMEMDDAEGSYSINKQRSNQNNDKYQYNKQAWDTGSNWEEEAEWTVVASPYVPRGRPGQVGTMPHLASVLRHFSASLTAIIALLVLWFAGFGAGVLFAFLFWHLQDLSAPPILFGVAAIFSQLSELLAYLFIHDAIKKFGHASVMNVALIANFVRFLCVSYLNNPWWILPVEFLQGLTHSSLWAAGCSFLASNMAVEMRPTAHLVAMATYQALGRASGMIIGGAFVSQFGSTSVFRGYSVCCGVMFVLYWALNRFLLPKLTPSPIPGVQPSGQATVHVDSFQPSVTHVHVNSFNRAYETNGIRDRGYTGGYGRGFNFGDSLESPTSYGTVERYP